MTRLLFVDEEASEEAEAQVRYYAERAGTHVALRFITEVEAVYRGFAESRNGSVIVAPTHYAQGQRFFHAVAWADSCGARILRSTHATSPRTATGEETTAMPSVDSVHLGYRDV